MTIEKAMAAVDAAIQKAIAAQRANWEGDEDEDTQRAHADHHRDMARRGILALAEQAKSEAMQECIGILASVGHDNPLTANDCIDLIRAKTQPADTDRGHAS